ncbi:hypothetical protein AAVH_40752, partial [Aphelenchoides avenae]
MVDRLGSVVHCYLLSFDLDAVPHIRQLFDIQVDWNEKPLRTDDFRTEFGAEPRSALRQLFDVPDQVLLDVFRNVPALSDHPIYTEVLKNVYPSWRECIRKEASNMPKLVG